MSATIKSEYSEFLMPEQQIDVAVSSRLRNIPFLEDSAAFDTPKLPNRHVETLIDEFSRNFIVVGVGKNEPEHTPIIKYRTPPALAFPHESATDAGTDGGSNESDDDKNSESIAFQDCSRLLLHYHPGFVSSTSSIRNIPGDECRAYLSDYSSTDIGLLINAIRFNVPNVRLFEPIFASICLFYLPASSSAPDPEKAIRVSESLYVDFTPEDVRKQFNDSYIAAGLDAGPIVPPALLDSLEAFERLVRIQDDSDNATPTAGRPRRPTIASNATNAIHPCTLCSRGVFQIPAELKNATLYLVVQVSKILSGDADKALEPYIKKKGADMTKLTENISRLSNFRQPLFIGACKVFDDSGVLRAVDKSINLCKLKSVPSEREIGQFLIEGIGLGGAEGQVAGDDTLADRRTDAIVQVGLEDLGSFNEVPKSISTSVPNACLFPADYNGPAQAIVEASKFQTAVSVPVRLCSHVALRQDVESMTDVTHKMFTSFRNSLLLYPLEFERFQNRNLCVKIEVCELDPNSSVNQNDLIAGAARLPCIYNRGVGPVFSTCAYSEVTYHSKSPLMNEEIKIRLPDRLNENHNIIFSVYHVHVKPKTGLFSRKSVAGQAAYELVGVGALPLLPNRSSLISNDVHAVLVQTQGVVADDDDDDGGEQAKGRPTRSASVVPSLACMLIRVRTRAYSSTYPVEDRIFSAFMNCPPPLGSLQTSKIEIRQSVTVSSQSKSSEVIASLSANKLDSGGVTAMSNPLTALETTAVVASKSNSTNYPLPRILCAPSLRGGTTEQQLRDVAKNIRQASSGEVSLHFLGIMRFLIRVMLGGNGRFSLDFANPKASPLSRCEAFLTMLSVFGNIAPNVVTQTERGRYNLEDLLIAYVEFFFDEEMAETYEQYQRRQVTSLQSSSTSASVTANTSRIVNTKDIDDQIDQYAEYVIDQSSDAIIEEVLRHIIKNDTMNDPDITKTMLKEVGANPSASPRHLLKKAQSRNRKVDFSMGEVAAADVKDDNEFSATLAPLRQRMQKLEGFSSSRKIQLKKFLRGDVAESKSNVAGDDEEEEEEEDESPIGADPPPFKWWPWLYEVVLSQWYCLMCTLQGVGIEGEDESESYPISKEDIEEARFQTTGQSFRSLVLDHGSLLFKLILKSLAIRVKAEEKEFPVILDEATVSSLVSLVKYLSLEIMSRKGHQWHCEVLNKSLAGFIKSLFAYIAPVHIVRLVEAYVSASRSKHAVEEIDLRINFIDMVSSFDYYVAVNNPFALSKITRVKSRPARPLAASPRIGTKPTKAWSGGTMVRGVQSPPNQWLATTIIEELGPYLSHELSTIRLSSLRVIRCLLVGHSYDMRFASLINRQRVAAMYAKLIDTLVLKTDEISVMTVRTVERKELLVVFLYLLEECPDGLLKDMWRDMCRPTMYKSAAKKKPASSDASRQRLRAAMAGDTSSKSADQGPVELQIMRVLKLLHLCIETFEQPQTLSENDIPTALLVPGLELQGMESGDGRASMKRGGGLKGSDALAALNEVMKGNVAKGRRAESRLKTQSSADSASGGEVKRSWKDNRASKAVSTMRKTLGVSSDLNPASIQQASKWMTHETTRIVSKTLLSIVKSALPVLGLKLMTDDDGQQTASLLVTLTKSKFSSTSFLGNVQNFGLKVKNPALSFLDNVKETPADGLLKIILRVSLHELCSCTSSLALEGAYETLCRIIYEFGGRKFLMIVGDLLQDWLRILLSQINSESQALSSAASGFLVLLFRCVFYDYGSVTLVEVPFKAVFVEVLEKEIEKKKASFPIIKEDKAIAPLRAQFDRMLSETSNADASFTHRLSELVESCEDLVLATLALREIVKNRSPFMYYDFEGPENDSGTCQSFDDEPILASRKPVVQPVAQSTPSPSRMSMSLSSNSPPPAAISQESPKKSKIDAYSTQEMLYGAVCKFPVTQLPRNRIYWLQQLFAFNIQEGKFAEAAGVKMQIVSDLKKVMSIVEEMWSIRRPVIAIHRSGDQSALDSSVAADSKDDSGASTASSSMASLPSFQSNDFASIVEAVDNSPPNKAFSSHRHVVGIIVSSLRTALDLYCEQSLLFLADDAARELLSFLRSENNLKEMESVYQKMGRLFATAGEVDLAFAMGSYFRVAFLGSIVPDNIRNKEFVYRMGSHLHVSEFHAHIETSLRDLIRETQGSGKAGEVIVKLLKDAAEEPPADDASQVLTGYIKITALKSIRWARDNDTVEDVAAVIRSSSSQASSATSTGSNQLRLFKFDIPFTPGGKIHGEILDQCKNTTVVSVNVPFPCAMSRQLVASRSVVVRRPIEVAMDDIRQRISEMEAELHKTDVATDKNNLKRLVQGSVMPQVNAGAAAVATAFLKPITAEGGMPELILVTGEDEAELLRRALREVFVAFLDLCSALLTKSTRLMTPVIPTSPKKGDPSADPDTIWLSEMRRGYGNMVEIMYPLVRQGEGALDQIQSRRFLFGGGEAAQASDSKFTSHDGSAVVRVMT